MARRSRRHRPEPFNLAFLDAVSCGFGAIVVLLVLTKMGEPTARAAARDELDTRIALLEAELGEIRRETTTTHRRLVAQRESVDEEQRLIEKLRGDLSRLEGEFAATAELSEVQEGTEGRLLAARQTLTEEMRRLLGEQYRRPKDDATIGGIPVDSEYIIFVIDTSGSMFTNTWSLVVQKMQETLDIYPEVKGLQVMNDMGQYMFGTYAGKWIPDTPSRRRLIIQTLRGWNSFSNSSPVEGIQRAIRQFTDDDKKISIYVFGDEFTGRSIQDVLDVVKRYNARDAAGNKRVRIHAVGFPTLFLVPGVPDRTGIRFATLMRELCAENGGTFVGLNHIRP